MRIFKAIGNVIVAFCTALEKTAKTADNVASYAEQITSDMVEEQKLESAQARKELMARFNKPEPSDD